MEVKNLIEKGAMLQMDLDITAISTHPSVPVSQTSTKFVICSSTVFQMRLSSAHYLYNCNFQGKTLHSVYISFVKLHPEEYLHYTIKLTSQKLDLEDKCFCNDDGTWHLVKEFDTKYNTSYAIDVKVQLDVVPSPSSFSALHEDTELLDFELQGADGSVHFHKVVLAASSPVLRRMLGGTWRETTEGRVDVLGTSKKTLQYLKNYMYLHTLPEEDIEQLLLLSLYYMMPDLEQWCVHRLMETLTPQNTCDLLKFAGKHEITSLILAILKCVDHGNFSVEEICNNASREENWTSDD